MSTPTPTRLTLTLLHAEVDSHRDLDCRHYDDCIDRAAIERWTSFSCRGCPVGRLAHHTAPKLATYDEDTHLPLSKRVCRIVTAKPLRPWRLEEVHEAVGPSAYTRDQVTSALANEVYAKRLMRVAVGVYAPPSLPLQATPKRRRAISAGSKSARTLELLTNSDRGWTAEQVIEALDLQPEDIDTMRRILAQGVRRGHWARLGFGIYGMPDAEVETGPYKRDRIVALLADGKPRRAAEVASELSMDLDIVAPELALMSRQGRIDRIERGLYQGRAA